jgi:DNA-binding IclR family transcriptional regulator
MPKKRLGAEGIVTKLRQIEVLQAQGKSLAAACREAGTTEQSYYRCARNMVALALIRQSGSNSSRMRIAD